MSFLFSFSAIAHADVTGYKRSLLDAFPQVRDEENGISCNIAVMLPFFYSTKILNMYLNLLPNFQRPFLKNSLVKFKGPLPRKTNTLSILAPMKQTATKHYREKLRLTLPGFSRFHIPLGLQYSWSNTRINTRTRMCLHIFMYLCHR